MSYSQTVRFLDQLQNNRGMLLGLDRVRAVLVVLGNPEKTFRSVLIAGTNGKGSVAAALSSVLTANGIKTGLYTSPHLVEYTERIRLNERDLSPALFSKFVMQVIRAQKKARVELTVFEVVTLAAFLAFRAAKVEWAVLEVGLGGRLDATNVVKQELGIITNIELEHTQVLGKTIEKIAAEKAGIVKPGTVLLTGASLKANAIIKKVCSDLVAGFTRVTSAERLKAEIELKNFSLTGQFQQENLGVIFAAVNLLKALGVKLGDDRVRKGLASVRWPGRFQVLPGKPVLVLDGAHNPAGMSAFLSAFKRERFPKPWVMIVGLQQDKASVRIAKLVTAIHWKELIVTASKHPHAARPADLQPKFPRSLVIPNPDLALEFARKNSPRGTIVIAGSLYLIGEILRCMGKRAKLPKK